MMKAEKFDAIVKARADQRIQERLKIFKDDVRKALEKLTGHSYAGYRSFGSSFWKVLTGDNWHKGWPKTLWTEEEVRVENELLATLNEMQKAFLALEKEDPENPDRCLPNPDV